MQILTLAHVYCKTIVGRNEKKEGLSGHSICTTIDMYFTGGKGRGGGGVICSGKIVADNPPPLPPQTTAVDKNLQLS